jgi:hypothetical protein
VKALKKPTNMNLHRGVVHPQAMHHQNQGNQQLGHLFDFQRVKLVVWCTKFER